MSRQSFRKGNVDPIGIKKGKSEGDGLALQKIEDPRALAAWYCLANTTMHACDEPRGSPERLAPVINHTLSRTSLSRTQSITAEDRPTIIGPCVQREQKALHQEDVWAEHLVWARARALSPDGLAFESSLKLKTRLKLGHSEMLQGRAWRIVHLTNKV